MRLSVLALPIAVLLTGCAADQNPFYQVGIGDYRRGTALEAPFVFGRTDTLSGDPIRAARAARDIEVFAYSLEEDPLWRNPRNATLQPQMQIARRELRGALGIPANVRSDVAAAHLDAAYRALEAGDTAAARAVLTPLGGPATLDRLAALPRLPRVEEAAAAIANEAGQSRNPRSGGGRG